ncbi:MAG: DUF2807 domain-containing protein [Hyphomonadaceae bacterium]|nr:DUF2807 domain-containing protein [Hyphomonadaceae bacterium]
MERFVFFAAITFAVIFGIVTLVDGPDWHFDVDMDGPGGRAAIVETAPGRFEPQAFAGESLRLRHLAANVTITPEDRADFLIEITSPGGAPMPTVAAEDGRITIDGQLRGRISNCGDESVELNGYGDLPNAQMPQIVIRAPRTLRVSRSGAGPTAIGPADLVDLDATGCGVVNIADVTGALSVELAGAGDVIAGAARQLKASVAGSGEVTIGAVTEGAEIEIAGSGTVEVASLTGDLSVDAAGSGNAVINGGQINEASIDMAGSGDVTITAPVQTLRADIVGSGDVDVNGVVGSIDADIAGSGNVSADSVTGTVTKDVLGSGNVRIGG